MQVKDSQITVYGMKVCTLNFCDLQCSIDTIINTCMRQL